MNVLDAFEKLNQYDTNISYLVRVIMRLDSDREFKKEVDLINELKNNMVREKDELKLRLSKTTLQGL